jgi:SnoaL-like domain
MRKIVHANAHAYVVALRLLPAVLCLPALAGCGSSRTTPEEARMREFATGYTAAWCSQKPASVAAYFTEAGSLTVNEAPPAVGRAAITEVARGFMAAFPDLLVTMDGIDIHEGRVIYHWTLTGTNAGPGGTGKPVRISGYEEWTMSPNGLIASSRGHFDQAEYQRQLKDGIPE